jgi:polyisoprenoid-binding protein YceI
MKKNNTLILAVLLVALSAFTWKVATNWKLSDDYSIKFAGTDAEGIFKKMSGDVVFDENNLSNANFSFTVEVASINTGNGMKNKHAVSDKWFNAEKYPNIVFKSKSISKSDKGYSVTGNMTIHGITKEMTVPFSFIKNTITTKFSVKRMDFKVGTMEGMSKKVSNEIKLDVSIPLTKK